MKSIEPFISKNLRLFASILKSIAVVSVNQKQYISPLNFKAPAVDPPNAQFVDTFQPIVSFVNVDFAKL
jgi:hypothetical protein